MVLCGNATIILIGLLTLTTAFQLPWSTSTSQNAQPLPLILEQDGSTLDLNATLGFQQIVVVHSPAMDNRRDELAMMSAVSGLTLTYSDRIVANLSNTTFSAGAGMPWHAPDLTLEDLANFRSHARVWRKIVESNISSSLILSDTVDWDTDIFEQFQMLQSPLAHLINGINQFHSAESMESHQTPTVENPFSVDGWDILLLGCEVEEAPATEADQLYVQYRDRTVAPSTTTSQAFSHYLQAIGVNLPWAMNLPGGSFNVLKDTESDESLCWRLVAQARSPRCSAGYALSRRGAAKLLYLISRGLHKPVQAMISDLVSHQQLRAYIVVPSLFGTWTQDPDSANSNPSHGRADNVRESVRQNLKRLIWAY